jgi:hypothetical protein
LSFVCEQPFHGIGDIGVLAGKDVRSALNDRDVAAEATVRLREL